MNNDPKPTRCPLCESQIREDRGRPYIQPNMKCQSCWHDEDPKPTTLIGRSRDEWVAHIDELFRIAHPGEDIPEAALVFGWQGTPTAADFAWAKEQLAAPIAPDAPLEHHPWCNFYGRPREGCKQCAGLFEKYPITVGGSVEELTGKYFPNVKIINRPSGDAPLDYEGEPKKKYLDWANAGGPNECQHGYAAGIPCPQCDEAKLEPEPAHPICERCTAGDHSLHDRSIHRLGCQEDDCNCMVEPIAQPEEAPLRWWYSECDTTISGHQVIARGDEAPYAYTCAGTAQEICDAVNRLQPKAAGAAVDGELPPLDVTDEDMESGKALQIPAELKPDDLENITAWWIKMLHWMGGARVRREAQLRAALRELAALKAQESPEDAWKRGQIDMRSRSTEVSKSEFAWGCVSKIEPFPYTAPKESTHNGK